MKWKNIRDFEIDNQYVEIDLKKLKVWLDKECIKKYVIEFNVEDINRMKTIKNILKDFPNIKDHKQLFKNQKEVFLVFHSYKPREYIVNNLIEWTKNNCVKFYIEENGWYSSATTIVIKLN